MLVLVEKEGKVLVLVLLWKLKERLVQLLLHKKVKFVVLVLMLMMNEYHSFHVKE